MNGSFDRKGHESYKSASRMIYNHTGRQSSNLSGTNLGQQTPQAAHTGQTKNYLLSGNSPNGTFIGSSGNRNANFGLKSDATFDFGVPTATTASSDTNMLLNQKGARALSNAPAPPSA